MKTIIFSCSERAENLSFKAAKAILSYFEDAEIIDLRNYHLQLIGTADDNTNKNLEILFQKFEEAQQIIFVSPEYNWSISPNAKNLLDYLSMNDKIWSEKIFMCFGCSAGRGGRLPIIELWKNINKIISFTHSISFVSPFHIEITANLLSEDGQFIDSFKPTAEKVFQNHKKLLEKFFDN
jgi:NAD(P)H-dependent FMN reductase